MARKRRSPLNTLLQSIAWFALIGPFLFWTYLLFYEKGVVELTQESAILDETKRRVKSLPRREIATADKLSRQWERIETEVRRETTGEAKVTGEQGLWIEW